MYITLINVEPFWLMVQNVSKTLHIHKHTHTYIYINTYIHTCNTNIRMHRCTDVTNNSHTCTYTHLLMLTLTDSFVAAMHTVPRLV